MEVVAAQRKARVAHGRRRGGGRKPRHLTEGLERRWRRQKHANRRKNGGAGGRMRSSWPGTRFRPGLSRKVHAKIIGPHAVCAFWKGARASLFGLAAPGATDLGLGVVKIVHLEVGEIVFVNVGDVHVGVGEAFALKHHDGRFGRLGHAGRLPREHRELVMRNVLDNGRVLHHHFTKIVVHG